MEYAYDGEGRLEHIAGTGLPAGGGVVYERVNNQSTVVSDLIGTIE